MRTVRETTKHGANLVFIPVFVGLGISVILYHMTNGVSVLLILVGFGIGLTLLFKHPFGVVYVIDDNGNQEYHTQPITNMGEN